MSEISKLIVLSKNLRGQSFAINKAELVVGRVDDCDITLADSTISTHHATIIDNGDGSLTVKDNGSTNGTRVNGSKVSEKVLNGGDVVQFGGVELLYDNGEEASDTAVTQTAFDITKTAGTIELSEDLANMNPFASGKKGGSGGTAKTVFSVVITVLIIAIGVLLWKVLESLGQSVG